MSSDSSDYAGRTVMYRRHPPPAGRSGEDTQTLVWLDHLDRHALHIAFEMQALYPPWTATDRP